METLQAIQKTVAWSNGKDFPSYPLSHVVIGIIASLTLLITVGVYDFPGADEVFYTALLLVCGVSAMLAHSSAYALLLDVRDVKGQIWAGLRFALTFHTALIALIVIPVFFIAFLSVGPLKTLNFFENFLLAVGTGFTRWRAFAAIPLSVFAEEVFFRGWIYVSIRGKWGRVGGLLASSLIFAVYHFGSISEMFMIFFVGLILAHLVEKTRSLIPAIVFHALDRVFSIVIFGLG